MKRAKTDNSLDKQMNSANKSLNAYNFYSLPHDKQILLSQTETYQYTGVQTEHL